MKPFIIAFTFLVSFVTFAQNSLKIGDKISTGKIILVNDEEISFYNLEFTYDEKITFTNAENLQSEFLYRSSVKSIESDNNTTYDATQISKIESVKEQPSQPKEKTYTIIQYKDKTIEVENPGEDKAVVYFVRTNSTGYLINFRYFDYDKFIGKFAGQGFIRYECDPGKHAFWVGASNSSYITAELETGKIYVIETIPVMGMAYARVKVEIPDRLNPKKYKSQKKRIFAVLANKNLDKSNPKDVLYATQSDYQKEISKGIENYEDWVEKEHDHLLLSVQYFE